MALSQRFGWAKKVSIKGERVFLKFILSLLIGKPGNVVRSAC